jgi:K(+)-stimulated pyrophosphate-energized sodium pump
MYFSIYVPLAGILALVFAFYLSQKVMRVEPGNARMIEIAAAISEGAKAYLTRQYKTLVFFVAGLAAIIFLAGTLTSGLKPETAVAFVIGALCSSLAGIIGMSIATKANVRTANAAQTSSNAALDVAFSGGAVMGMTVVGLGLTGLGIVTFLFDDTTVINGFALGASLIALFSRVGGGIYTKAADVGADLVGKVEAGIPEDDPRNPAVIADNVGDNVGDVAGMGADLFESYVGSIIAAVALAVGLGLPIEAVYLPFFISAAGIVCSIIGTFFVRVKEGESASKALNMGEFIAMALTLVTTYFLATMMLPKTGDITGMGVFIATITGLLATILYSEASG